MSAARGDRGHRGEIVGHVCLAVFVASPALYAAAVKERAVMVAARGDCVRPRKVYGNVALADVVLPPTTNAPPRK